MKDLDKTKDYSRKFIIVGVILIILFGLILGYLSADLYNKYKESKDISRTKNLSEVSQVSTTDIRLQEDATIVYSRVYLKCNELNREQKTAEKNTIGKNKSELEALFTGWNIVDITPDKLILEKSINSYSPQYFKIGTHESTDGEKMVATYTFDIDGNEVLETVTDTPIDLLHEDEAKKLDVGIVTKDKDQFYEMLQNYDE